MPLPLLHYLYPSGLSKFLRQHEGEASWALVTGASDGIGRALCFELAARGFNVVLHGRNETKLARVRDELEATHPTRRFRTATADASSFSAADIDRIVGQVADVPLTILINNVGGTAPLSSNFKYFECTTPKEMEALFSLNIRFPLQLTHALLLQLQQQQQPTLVLNCGSQAAIGQPYVSTYAATKGALHTWTRALAAEQRAEGTKVEVMETVIGATYTQQFHGDSNFKPGLFMPTADVMARAVLSRVGCGHTSVVAYFWHNVQTTLLYSLLPAATADGIIAGVLKPSVEAKIK